MKKNGNQTDWGYYTYDIDNPDSDVVAKTDVHHDGTVHRYDSTDGDFDKGHGHRVYGDSWTYASDGKPTYDRNPNDPKSVGRKWDWR